MSRLVWITGAGGLIGSSLVNTASHEAQGWDVLGLNRTQLDLSDEVAVQEMLERNPPSLIIHCAAMSRSPLCEAHPEQAEIHNIQATSRLSRLAGSVPMVFMSTDQVFDGTKGAYAESDMPNPLNVYARSKVASERELLGQDRRLIIRTSLNGGRSPTGDRGFNEQLRQLWAQGKEMRFFDDEFRSPIAACETARAVWRLALLGCTGIYNVAGAEKLSRWEMGSLLAQRWQRLNPRISRGSLREYEGPPRAADTTLNCTQAESVLGYGMPRFSEWLATQPADTF